MQRAWLSTVNKSKSSRSVQRPTSNEKQAEIGSEQFEPTSMPKKTHPQLYVSRAADKKEGETSMKSIDYERESEDSVTDKEVLEDISEDQDRAIPKKVHRRTKSQWENQRLIVYWDDVKDDLKNGLAHLYMGRSMHDQKGKSHCNTRHQKADVIGVVCRGNFQSRDRKGKIEESPRES